MGSRSVNFDLRVDPLSVTMILVVTGSGSLIHLYAIGYMNGDGRFGRFFAYTQPVLLFMLMLVLANDLLLLYLGWEGVGLCSYLLIGFWFDKTAKRQRREEGVRHDPRRRRALDARGLVRDVRALRVARLRRGASGSDGVDCRR